VPGGRLAWARERKTFGMPLIERQVIRHKLVDMAVRIDTTRAMLEDLAWRVEHERRRPARPWSRSCRC
jgi:acyl-CoA dehydrogenase